MKYVLFLIVTIYPSSLFAGNNEDIGYHIGVSMGIAFSAYSVCKYPLKGDKLTCTFIAAGASMLAGALKEVADTHNSNKEHTKDLAADAIGTGIGLLLTIPF